MVIIIAIFIWPTLYKYDRISRTGRIVRFNRITGDGEFFDEQKGEWWSSKREDEIRMQRYKISDLQDSVKVLNHLLAGPPAVQGFSRAALWDSMIVYFDSVIDLNLYLNDLLENNTIVPKPETLGIHYSRPKGPVTFKEIMDAVKTESLSIFYKKKKQ